MSARKDAAVPQKAIVFDHSCQPGHDELSSLQVAKPTMSTVPQPMKDANTVQNVRRSGCRARRGTLRLIAEPSAEVARGAVGRLGPR
jgi:hypothetical protein